MSISSARSPAIPEASMIGEGAALGAALCWTVGPLLAMRPVRALGTMVFARVRLVVAALGLALVTTLAGGWHGLDASTLQAAALSGIVGFALGDYLLFAGLRIIGPRRGGLIYTLNAPVTALMAYYILGEPIATSLALGGMLAITGVAIAIAFRNRNAGEMETVRGSLPTGILLCFAAAVTQGAGVILVKPALEGTADPLAVSALRAAVAAAVFFALAVVQGRLRDYILPRGLMLQTVLHASIGPGLGALLMMVAIAHTTAAAASILSSLSPVLILPILHWGFRERLNIWCWLGATVTMAGVALIVAR